MLINYHLYERTLAILFSTLSGTKKKSFGRILINLKVDLLIGLEVLTYLLLVKV